MDLEVEGGLHLCLDRNLSPSLDLSPATATTLPSIITSFSRSPWPGSFAQYSLGTSLKPIETIICLVTMRRYIAAAMTSVNEAGLVKQDRGYNKLYTTRTLTYLSAPIHFLMAFLLAIKELRERWFSTYRRLRRTEQVIKGGLVAEGLGALYTS